MAAQPQTPARQEAIGGERARVRLHFDLVDLRLFVNIAEANSLTGGAERSFLSLPAVSTRIKHLEEMVGAKLLYRTSHGVTLTPPGLAFAHHARLVLAQLEQLRGDLQEYASGVKGHLRVFASTTAIAEFLPAVLRQYLRTHPDVNIDLRERMSVDIVRAVIEGSTDIGIVSGMVRTEGLQTLPYRQDRLVLAVPAQHPLAEQAAVEFADTLDYDHVTLHEASAIHTFLHQRARELHRNVRTRIQVGNFEAACRLIEAGVGVGLLPNSAARRYAQSMGVRVVPLSDDWSLRPLHIVVRSLDLLPAFAIELVELLVADARAAADPSA
jgi:DNA-binding transcriptional LysR family regulator